ncbi:hypothetical protein [Nocardioides sp.]|uniref:hypothetical protein n=1 Tax=Nocardioides sp. TaxID=35761 RepID=UPI0039E5073B
MDQPDVPDEAVRDEEDHDLLTFLESGIRLREEIAQIEEALAQDSTQPPREVLLARLSALRAALARNSKHEESSPGEAGFLNYSPRRAADR